MASIAAASSRLAKNFNHYAHIQKPVKAVKKV
jgi:hypothetical protein